MLFHMQDYVEIARRAGKGTGFASAGKSDPRTVFHTGGNFRVDRALPQDATFASALWAWIGDHIAGSLTGGASAGNAEESLLVADLAPARARSAGSCTLARRSA